MSSVLDSLNKNVIESLNKSNNELMRTASNKQLLSGGVNSASIENIQTFNDDSISTTSNTNDFVDDFINDYLNNTLNNNLNGTSQISTNNISNSGPIDIINKKNATDSNSDTATPFVTNK